MSYARKLLRTLNESTAEQDFSQMEDGDALKFEFPDKTALLYIDRSNPSTYLTLATFQEGKVYPKKVSITSEQAMVFIRKNRSFYVDIVDRDLYV